MTKEWYDMIALRNRGYKSNSIFSIEGLYGEDVFEKRLIAHLGLSSNTLDAGCGDGEFTIKMSKYAQVITGFDNSYELLKIAKDNLKNSKVENVNFVSAWTKDKNGLPFDDDQFDFIFCRRGPTSIINHPRILKSKGIIMGIHSAEIELVRQRLLENDFKNIEIEIFDEAIAVFPNEEEFTKYLSAFPGNPDYLLTEYSSEISEIIEKHRINGRLEYTQWRYIWRAEKP